MRTCPPLELYISDAAFVGFLMCGPAILFLLIGLILLLKKDKKTAKTMLIISGICLLVALGLCSVGM